MKPPKLPKPTIGKRQFALNHNAPTPSANQPLKEFRRTSHALGCDISMLLLHHDETIGQSALTAAFAELERVERVMSIYRPESEVSRLNTIGVFNDPDPYMVQVLEESRAISQRSDGAFDVTVQPLWTLYATAQRSGTLPSDAEIDAARKKVGWRRMSISPREIRLHEPGMAITLNGIAQGFAADRAMEAIKKHGIAHALVNTGEISSLGRKAGGEPWRVGIQHPRQPDAYLGLAQLDGRCMTTSGDYETKFSDDFVYNHIFDPASGRSPRAFSSVSVVAPTATEADGLSTAIFVLGPEKGLALARASRDVDVLLVMKDGQTLASDGFPWSR